MRSALFQTRVGKADSILMTEPKIRSIFRVFDYRDTSRSGSCLIGVIRVIRVIVWELPECTQRHRQTHTHTHTHTVLASTDTPTSVTSTRTHRHAAPVTLLIRRASLRRVSVAAARNTADKY